MRITIAFERLISWTSVNFLKTAKNLMSLSYYNICLICFAPVILSLVLLYKSFYSTHSNGTGSRSLSVSNSVHQCIRQAVKTGYLTILIQLQGLRFWISPQSPQWKSVTDTIKITQCVSLSFPVQIRCFKNPKNTAVPVAQMVLYFPLFIEASSLLLKM